MTWSVAVAKSPNGHHILGVCSLNHFARLLGWRREHIEHVAEHAGRFYRPFDRRKRAGVGKWRHIDCPQGELLDLQRQIQRRILGNLILPFEILGGIRGKSIRDNGRLHVRQPTVASLDLCNCFPGINDLSVFRTWVDVLGFGHDVAAVLTKLTTFQHRLPQGAPTSTMLANLVLLPVFERLVELAHTLGLAVSFWVDDVIFSGHRAHLAIGPAIRIIQSYGHAVSRGKVKVMRRHLLAQLVTGAVVNRGVSAGAERIQRIRDEILELERIPEVPDWRLRSIWGRIAYVRSLRRSQGDALGRLAERCIPETGVGGQRPRTDETRPCMSTRQHRYD